MKSDYPIIEQFYQARQHYGHSAQELAAQMGVSREYLYEVLKFPVKNRELHDKLIGYIEEAGVATQEAE